MAAGPARRTQRAPHLNAHIAPVERALLERALLARAAAIEAETDDVTGVSESEVINTRARRAVAAEFRALAEELHWWG